MKKSRALEKPTDNQLRQTIEKHFPDIWFSTAGIILMALGTYFLYQSALESGFLLFGLGVMCAICGLTGENRMWVAKTRLEIREVKKLLENELNRREIEKSFKFRRKSYWRKRKDD